MAEIEKLITDGENPNIQDANSRTPLIVATYRKHYEAVEALLKRGANPNARDLQGFDMLTHRGRAERHARCSSSRSPAAPIRARSPARSTAPR